MSSRLATLTKKDRGDQNIIRVRPGVFGLREWGAVAEAAAATEADDAEAPEPAEEPAATVEDEAAEHLRGDLHATPTVVPGAEAHHVEAAEEVSPVEKLPPAPVPSRIPANEELEEVPRSQDEIERDERLAASADMFPDEEDDEEPVLGGAPEKAAADGSRRRRRRRRRGRGEGRPEGATAEARPEGAPAGEEGAAAPVEGATADDEADNELLVRPAGDGEDAPRPERAERPDRPERSHRGEGRGDNNREGRGDNNREARGDGNREGRGDSNREPRGEGGRDRDRDRGRNQERNQERDREFEERDAEGGRETGRDTADVVVALLSRREDRQPVSVRALVDEGLRTAKFHGDPSVVTPSVSAAIRMDSARRAAKGERARLRLAGGRVGLVDWTLPADLVRAEAEALAALERLREAARRYIVRRLNELPQASFIEGVVQLLEGLGVSSLRTARRPGIQQGEVHLAGIARRGPEEFPVAVVVRRGGEIGRERVIELRGAIHHYNNAQAGWLITTGNVLSGAREEAAQPGATPITLVDGATFGRLVDDHGVCVQHTTMTLPYLDVDLFDQLRNA